MNTESQVGTYHVCCGLHHDGKSCKLDLSIPTGKMGRS